MVSNSLWILLLILQWGIVTPRSALNFGETDDAHQRYDYETQNRPNDESSNDEQVISVRITSSVAVGRGRPKPFHSNRETSNYNVKQNILTTPPTEFMEHPKVTENDLETVMTEIPPNLRGANIEFIRQLNSKKESRSPSILGQNHPSHSTLNTQNTNETFPEGSQIKLDGGIFEGVDKIKLPETSQSHSDDSAAKPSVKTDLEIDVKNSGYENIGNAPLEREMLLKPSYNQVNKINEQVPNLTTGPFVENNSEHYNDTDDTVAASSVQSISTFQNTNESDEIIENVPLARSVPFSPSSKNYIQGLTNKLPSERGNGPSLTTVSFNIVHDTPKQTTDYNGQSSTFTNTNQGFDNTNKFYEQPKVYSQPAKIYSEPAKFYSEPAKIYSEPAKIYSEPAKVYSEPAKVYSEPAKFYSPPASLHLPPEVVPNYTPWQEPSPRPDFTSTIVTPIPTSIDTVPTQAGNTESNINQHPEKNYEVDEKDSVLTEGRSHGVQESSTEKCKEDNCKVGYVVEGRQYKKYRVEERTSDGFIVGEYGVVRNEDGALRGVRYTADSEASPRLIYDALMKFLQLK